MAGSFEVWIPSLRTASTGLSGAAIIVSTAGLSAAGAASGAAASCGGPLLTAALGRWSAEIKRCSQEASETTGGAAGAMVSNADRYEQDDTAASSSLDKAVQTDSW